jgi:hypothetical protein
MTVQLDRLGTLGGGFALHARSNTSSIVNPHRIFSASVISISLFPIFDFRTSWQLSLSSASVEMTSTVVDIILCNFSPLS